MSGEEKCKLIFKTLEYEIPSQFRSLVEALPPIQEAIRDKHRYEVQSDVSEEVFKSYVDNWISRDAPDITDENVEEYAKLSEEFGAMKDVVELYRKLTASADTLMDENKQLEKQIEEVSQQIEEKTNLYHQIYQYLFNNTGIDSHERFLEVKDELYEACQKENLRLVGYLTQKLTEQNGLTFSLNEKDMTAALLRNKTTSNEIMIPRKITYENQDYTVTNIAENSFRGNNSIKIVIFPVDSEVQTIEKDSFTGSSLENICIPASVTTIEEEAFSKCEQLQSVAISENSKLSKLGEKSFPYCPQLHISIPSSLKGELQVQFSNEGIIH